MNLCFLMGEIISDIEFQFVLDNQYISIARFEIQLKNKSKMKMKAYDRLADWCYQKLKKKDCIVSQGELDGKMENILHNIIKI